MKQCSKCQEFKEQNHFLKNKKCKSGFANICRKCDSIRQKIARDKFKEKNPNKYKEYYREYGKQWRLNNDDQRRDTIYKRLFNITLGDYNEILKKQNNVCAICKKPETSIDKRNNKLRGLSVDHCHKTGKVRGLLCRYCNTGIGLLRESQEILNNAITYLNSV
jgi:hypothetical protein